MKARYYLSPVVPRVPTASMADIAFLLIIFFMLTTSFSPERTSVQLPESQIRTEVSKDAAIVAITPRRHYQIHRWGATVFRHLRSSTWTTDS